MKGSPAPRLILGSGSPRRAALLRQLELSFEQVASPEEEPALQGDGPEACAVAAAGAKARAVHKLVRQRGLATNATIVIGADTIVSLDGRLLGKPRDAGEAVDMLRALSGHTHQVYTGLALVCGDDRELRDCSVTQVRMGRISERDISAYVRSGEPLDKAGAYGIQGLGARFIEHIEGCYYNVVGLPLARFSILLVEAGYNFNTTTGDDR